MSHIFRPDEKISQPSDTEKKPFPIPPHKRNLMVPNVASPTDKFLSPCSQKLVQKRKELQKKITPVSLTSRFQAAAEEKHIEE
ncbi:uncharacterized protein VTP21DRAFT_10136 [Calcarisporiella thermophila]|uniref:uncharacterized protein n=1 Tax=Calcarisporiella thermophila TaxID=911321 RepID=UPI00374226AC